MTQRPTIDVARVIAVVGSILLFAVEAGGVAPESSPLRAAAAWTWVSLSVVVLIGLMGISLATLGRQAGDAGWYAVALLLPPALVLYGITGYSRVPINLEGLQQVNEALNRISGRRDLGLFGSGFLGYPSRQYLLAALPSHWWGRHLVTLRLGYGLTYVIGTLTFTAGTASYLATRTARPRLMASLAGVLVALASFPLLYARLFEQTSLPLAITLLFLGSLQFFLAGNTAAALAGVWAVGFMPYAYTPALATWVLAMLVLALLLRCTAGPTRRMLMVAMAYGVVALAASILLRGPGSMLASLLRVGHYTPDGGAGYADSSPGAWLFRLVTGLHAAVGLEESLLPAPLVLGLLLVLADSLRRKDGRVLSVVAWAALTMGAALTLKGYWQRVPEFDLQRAMIVLPPLSLALALYLAERAEPTRIPDLSRLLKCVMVFMILNALPLVWLRRVPRDYAPSVVTDNEEATLLVLNQAEIPRTIYLAPPLDFPLETTLAYFRPGTRVIHGPAPLQEHQPGSYVISYAGDEPFIAEDQNARAEEYPARFNHPRPYLAIRPE